MVCLCRLDSSTMSKSTRPKRLNPLPASNGMHPDPRPPHPITNTAAPRKASSPSIPKISFCEAYRLGVVECCRRLRIRCCNATMQANPNNTAAPADEVILLWPKFCTQNENDNGRQRAIAPTHYGGTSQAPIACLGVGNVGVFS